METAQAYDINTDATVTAKKGELDTKKGALDTAEEALQTEIDGANNPGTVATLTEARDKAQAAYNEAQAAYDEALDAAQKKKDDDVAAAKEALTAAQKADIKANKPNITTSITQIEGAINTLRAMASTYGNNYSIVQNRQDFTDSLINVLTEGADNLTLADMNEESANMLASQASQAVLKLF